MSGGCIGSSSYEAWHYLAYAGGQATNDSYPYTAKKGKCKWPGFNTIKGATLDPIRPVYAITPFDIKEMMRVLNRSKLITALLEYAPSFLNFG